MVNCSPQLTQAQIVEMKARITQRASDDVSTIPQSGLNVAEIKQYLNTAITKDAALHALYGRFAQTPANNGDTTYTKADGFVNIKDKIADGQTAGYDRASREVQQVIENLLVRYKTLGGNPLDYAHGRLTVLAEEVASRP